MKSITPPLPALVVTLASALLVSCDRSSEEMARRIEQLEENSRKEAVRREALEQELEQRRAAAERDAIERERMLIEEERAALARQSEEESAVAREALRQREMQIARRQREVEETQERLAREQAELAAESAKLNERELELAGREWIDVPDAAPAEPVGTGRAVADFALFHNSLVDYGSWYHTVDYGYVWQPVVVRQVGWRPYLHGRWVCTDRGWMWISDEPFGWATYHYGRWALVQGLGWIWVPGDQWAPCWVSWRKSGSHIGWAPLPPESMHCRSHRWDHTVDARYGIGEKWYQFMEIRHFGKPAHRHCLPLTGNGRPFRESHNITHIEHHRQGVFSGGPGFRDLKQAMGRAPEFYRLEAISHQAPGRDPLAYRPRMGNGRIRVQAPEIRADWNEALRPPRVRQEMDSLVIERAAPVDAEALRDFREERQRLREQAEQRVTEAGGRDRFLERRIGWLEENRQVESARVDVLPEQVGGDLAAEIPRPRPGTRPEGRPGRPQGDLAAETTPPPLSGQEAVQTRPEERPDASEEITGQPAGQPGRPGNRPRPQDRPQPVEGLGNGNHPPGDPAEPVTPQVPGSLVGEIAVPPPSADRPTRPGPIGRPERPILPPGLEAGGEVARPGSAGNRPPGPVSPPVEEPAEPVEPPREVLPERPTPAEPPVPTTENTAPLRPSGGRVRDIQDSIRERSERVEALRRQQEEERARRENEAAALLQREQESRAESLARGQREQQEAQRAAEERQAAAAQAEAQARRAAEETQQAREADLARREEIARQQQQAELEAQRREQQEAQRQAQQEAMRRQQEEAQRQAQEEAMRRQQEEAQRRAQEEAMRRQQEEAQRRAQEEAMRRQQEEAQRQAQEEAMRRQQEEAQRRAQEEAMRRQQEEAQRQAQEEAMRRQQEEAQRRAQEEAMRRQQEEAQRREQQP